MALALLLFTFVPGTARAQQPDSDYVRIELGGTSDVTNERFYEDTFDDTTFTGRRLTGSPEYRTAALAALGAAGPFAPGGRYALIEEATAGDHLLRNYTRLDLRGEPGDGWRLSLTPELDVRRDRSFGGDQSELRFRPEGRVRRTSLDGSDAWELLAGGDWYRTRGTSEVIALDRNAGRAWLRWTHTPLGSPWDWELGYGADVRAFPDSVIRDHVEQHGALTLRRLLPTSGAAAIDAQVDRRQTLYETPSTRDQFWSGRADGSAFVQLHPTLTAELWVSVEGYRYDQPDTSAYFDYQSWTLSPSLRWSLAHDWGLRAGPRFAWLLAPRVPSERYREVAGVIEAERLHAGDWWSFTPAAGWREYERSESSVSLADPDLHSSYLFLEFELFADVGLPGGIRARVSGGERFEQHEDPSQDATSLYFSLELRRAF